MDRIGSSKSVVVKRLGYPGQCSMRERSRQ